MPRRVQVEVLRPNGTIEVLGEFKKEDNEPTDAPDISVETSYILEACFEKITVYDVIQFWDEWVP